MSTEPENVTQQLATLRRNVPMDLSGFRRPPEISTAVGLLPEQFREFMDHGECSISRGMSAKRWRAICEAAEFNQKECITSPFGVLGHDVIALHLISSPRTDEERLFQSCKIHATANMPRFHSERAQNGRVVSLHVRLDYAGMIHGDLWPEQVPAPGGQHTRTPFHR